MITLDVGNELFIVHFWISGAEVKKIFEDSSVIMLECLKIKERAGIDGSYLLIRDRVRWETQDAHLVIKSLSGTEQDGIEFSSIESDRDVRFRLLILVALAETDELVFKREEVGFELG